MSSDAAHTPRARPLKLDAEKARAIAEQIAAGERHTTIAETFGVSVETVGAIKSGKRWAGAIDDELRVRMSAARSASTLDAARAAGVMAALEAGRSGASIAEEYGVSPSLVSAIKRGEAWSALDPGLPARLAAAPRQGKTLTAPEVAHIKFQLAQGRSSRKVASEFGVSPSTVRSIARGKTWTDVEPAGDAIDAHGDGGTAGE